MADRPKNLGPKSIRLGRRRRTLAMLAVVCLGMGSGSGCTMMNGIHQGVTNNQALDEFMVSYRNRAWSARSWHNNKHKFCNRKYMKDFQAGYRAGYEDVASGGHGCTPALPPSEYWGWKYQSPEGQAKVNAWFEAYPLGARAAEEDGLNTWGHIRTMLPAEQATGPGCLTPGHLHPEGVPMQGAPMHGVPMNGAPTPIEGMEMHDGAMIDELGMMESRPTARQLTDYSNFDFSSVPVLKAGEVPTVASGR